jgi:hypothetical protein
LNCSAGKSPEILKKVTDVVSPGLTESALPVIVKSMVLPSLLKIVIFINADRVFLEVFVTRASAPALPRSEFQDIDSKRNDLLCIEFDFDLLGSGFADVAVLDGLATHTRLQVNFLPAAVVV